MAKTFMELAEEQPPCTLHEGLEPSLLRKCCAEDGPRVLLVVHHEYPEALNAVYMLQIYLANQGFKSMVAPPYHEEEENKKFVESLDFSRIRLVISLGGDGTLLRAARMIGYREIPLLGLCFGHLGFLAASGKENYFDLVSEALSGELHLSRRSTLKVKLYYEGGYDEQPFETFALNELSITRGISGKMLGFDVSVNDIKMDSVKGDGFVVSTATGSTGYALSAGGPIVSPDFKGMICVPIAAHTLTSRAVLTAPSDVITLDFSKNNTGDGCVYVDGIALSDKPAPLKIEIMRGDGDILLLHRSNDAFYEAVSRVFYGERS